MLWPGLGFFWIGAPSTMQGEDRRLSVKARAAKSCILSLDVDAGL